MRDIRADLQDRAGLLEEQINAAQAQFEKVIDQLKREHEESIEALEAELEAVNRLAELEHRRLTSDVPPVEVDQRRRPATAEADEIESLPVQTRMTAAPDVEPRRAQAIEPAPQRVQAVEREQRRAQAPATERRRAPANMASSPEPESRRPQAAMPAEPEMERRRAPASASQPAGFEQRRPQPNLPIEPEIERRRPAASMMPAHEVEHRRAPSLPVEPEMERRRPPASMVPAHEVEHRRAPSMAAPKAPPVRQAQPQHEPQQPLADFLVRRLSEVGSMSREDLRRLALREGYFADPESAERGVHLTLVNVIKAGLARQLPNGNFAPASLMDTIRLRRAI
jgi:hypothetical protein